MPNLAVAQERFAALLAHGDDVAVDLFVGDVKRVAERLEIYRGNVRANALRALETAYPIVVKIVGAEFFAGLGREYQGHTPSASGDLNEYGAGFAEFLAGFPHVADLPYLPDVARMEWLAHRAHYAADLPPFDIALLGAVPEAQRAALQLRLHPACGLLESAFPLARIWTVHQDDYRGEFSVDWEVEREWLLVSRPRFRVQVAAIGAGEHAFLTASRRGATLAQALEAALAVQPSFDFAAQLASWVQGAVVVGFETPEEE